MQQMYYCPNCNYSIAFGARYCGNCGTPLNWSPPQQIQPPPFYSQPCGYQQTQWDYQQMPSYQQQQYEYKETRPRQQTTTSLLTGSIIILAIVLLTTWLSFIFNTSSHEIFSPVPPPTTLQLPVVPSIPEAPKANTVTPSDFVQQYTDKQPPCLRQSGEPINLVNNPDSRNVSFAELKSFISQDRTDDEIYMPGVRVCGDFAEMLHNNAEAKKIRASWVAIHWENKIVGHAINAFQTTDKGLIYIDCTGRGFKDAYEQQLYGILDFCNGDRVAYIEKGKQYGVLDINKVESLNYDFYVEYARNWQKFSSMADDYNKEVSAFNKAYANKSILPPSEYSNYAAWKKQLEEKERIIKELEKKLGNCFAKPLDIVKKIEIYW